MVIHMCIAIAAATHMAVWPRAGEKTTSKVLLSFLKHLTFQRQWLAVAPSPGARPTSALCDNSSSADSCTFTCQPITLENTAADITGHDENMSERDGSKRGGAVQHRVMFMLLDNSPPVHYCYIPSDTQFLRLCRCLWTASFLNSD